MTPDRLIAATADRPAPLAILDREAIDANAADLVRRAGGKPLRLATKSVRVRGLIEQVVARDGWNGLMTYSLAESNWLVDAGADDVLLAYPTVDRSAIAALVADERKRAAITLMVDSVEGLDVLDACAGVGHPEIRVAIDVDASLQVGPLHLGVRRSGLHAVADVEQFAAHIVDRPGFALVGLMFYDAQIAGVADSSPAIRLMKRRSAAELNARRHAVVEAVGKHAALELVNGGGTGSLEVTGADAVITELTAGSGLFTPTLFDRYDSFAANPAAYFALDVVRKPTVDIVTCFSGGYVASGPAGNERLPTPVWPRGLSLLGTEGAGEVQTPVKGAAALNVGDRVLFRHAKAGEMCERFDAVTLVGAAGVESLPTYRGEGRNFG